MEKKQRDEKKTVLILKNNRKIKETNFIYDKFSKIKFIKRFVNFKIINRIKQAPKGVTAQINSSIDLNLIIW